MGVPGGVLGRAHSGHAGGKAPAGHPPGGPVAASPEVLFWFSRRPEGRGTGLGAPSPHAANPVWEERARASSRAVDTAQPCVTALSQISLSRPGSMISRPCSNLKGLTWSEPVQLGTNPAST